MNLADLPDGEGWRVTRGDTVTEIHHARYAEEVRAFQGPGPFSRLGRGLRSLAGYLADGSGLRIARQAPRAAVLALIPVLATILPFAGLAAALAPVEPIDAAILLAAGLALVLLARYLFLLLVADLFAFYREIARGTSPAAERYFDCIRGLADAIPVTDPDPAPPMDERMVVGHSLGGIGAILATEALLDRLGPQDRLSLLTLGSNHGLILLQHGTGRDRLADAIARILRDPRVFWLDISSPRDAFCVPLTDPRLLLDATPDMQPPRILSAQLSKAPSIPGDRRTVFPAMRLHMGYLLPPSAKNAFDYCNIVTGVPTLTARYRARRDSPKARMWHA